MSMELYVALPAGEMAGAKVLAERGASLGFDLAFLPGFSLEQAGGFQPVTFAGKETGVEIDLMSLDDVPELAECLADKAAGFERVIAFRWASDFLEGGLAYALAAALAADERCVGYDPQEDAVMSAADLAEGARGMIAEANKA